MTTFHGRFEEVQYCSNFKLHHHQYTNLHILKYQTTNDISSCRLLKYLPKNDPSNSLIQEKAPKWRRLLWLIVQMKDVLTIFVRQSQQESCLILTISIRHRIRTMNQSSGSAFQKSLSNNSLALVEKTIPARSCKITGTLYRNYGKWRRKTAEPSKEWN